MNNVAGYFKASLEAQCNPVIDFSDSDSFVIISGQELVNGALFQNSLSEYKRIDKDSRSKSLLNVFISAKTVITEFHGGVRKTTQTADLTGVFYIPAILDSEGKLSINKGKLPYIPREYLYPMIDEELCIGKAESLDSFLEKTTADRIKLETWRDYLGYAISMFEYVSKTKFNENALSNKIKFDGRFYLFKDTSVNASKSIISLYDNMLSSLKDSTLPKIPLFNTLTDLKSAENYPLTSISQTTSMENHLASMNGEYPLSPSQREAVIHFNQLNDGDILAVNGPPGTGKTTLLQSIVAGMLVKHALNKFDAPVIVASSTNNQAVTNIIDSFGKINKVWDNLNIEERWVESAKSFATYFPSSSKKPSEYANYQFMDKDNTFLSVMDSEDNREKSKTLFISQFKNYFGTTFDNVQLCEQYIYQNLSKLDKLRRFIITETKAISDISNGNPSVYTCMLEYQIDEDSAELSRLTSEKESLKQYGIECSTRMNQWSESYKSLPFLVKLMSSFSFSKRKITQWFLSFRNERESECLNSENISLNSIMDYYTEQILQNDKEISSISEKISKLEQSINSNKNKLSVFNSKIQALLNSIQADNNAVRSLKKSDFSIIAECNTEKTNELLDKTIRYMEFWLAVHYYEAVFLQQKPFTEKQLSTNIEDVLKNKLKRLAMISPCFVMTFFMLPTKMMSYIINEKKYSYLYNFADLLIADEAGQTSPEIASASFSLAKKAVIVGDDDQIPPVWSMTQPLDMSLALEYGIISAKNPKDDFKILDKIGLTTSNSSLMRTASYSCHYNKFDRGLFLSEHRRCFDEIIGYCNDLLYEGHLEPKRGKSNTPFPCMAYHDIPTDSAGREGTSRVNRTEAEEIAKWLNLYFTELQSYYSNKKPEEILAIITPFKAQKKMLDRALSAYCTNIPNVNKIIKTGTVHTFQGAEKDVIIFSTVYGKNDTCGFIDGNKNLMNVAVSRAKDAFWVFGSIDCLKGKPKSSASGLMYEYVKDNQIE